MVKERMEKMSVAVPVSLERDIDAFQKATGCFTRSDALRELLELGVDWWRLASRTPAGKGGRADD